jgi:hypothetical protein
MKLKLEEIRKKLGQRGEQTFQLSRDMQVDETTIDKEGCTAEFSVSSEYPVMRWFGNEILDHQSTSIRWGRLTDGAAHRDGHKGDQIGIVDKAWIDSAEKKLRVKVRFSKNTDRAVQIFKDIVDGIRKNVSISYDIYDLVLESETENVDTYRITDWEPIHTCHTPDGADPTVGNGRSKEGEAIAPTTISLTVLNGNYEEAIREFNRGSETKITVSHKQASRETTPKEIALAVSKRWRFENFN